MSTRPRSWPGVAIGGHQYTWSYSGQTNNGGGFPALVDARYWASMAGMKITRPSARPHSRVELYGLNSSGGDRIKFVAPDGERFAKNPRVAGIDVAYPVTNTISFVGALNPDFLTTSLLDSSTSCPARHSATERTASSQITPMDATSQLKPGRRCAICVPVGSQRSFTNRKRDRSIERALFIALTQAHS